MTNELFDLSEAFKKFIGCTEVATSVIVGEDARHYPTGHLVATNSGRIRRRRRDLLTNISQDEQTVVGTKGVVWWHYDGKGSIFANGMKTKHEIPLLTINLEKANSPRLSVDRSEILEIDYDDIYEIAENAFPSLVASNWFCAEWLWRLSSDHPKLADRLFSYLSPRILLRKTAAETVEEYIDLYAIGLCPLDYELMKSNVNGVETSKSTFDFSVNRLALLREATSEGAEKNHPLGPYFDRGFGAEKYKNLIKPFIETGEDCGWLDVLQSVSRRRASVGEAAIFLQEHASYLGLRSNLVPDRFKEFSSDAERKVISELRRGSLVEEERFDNLRTLAVLSSKSGLSVGGVLKVIESFGLKYGKQVADLSLETELHFEEDDVSLLNSLSNKALFSLRGNENPPLIVSEQLIFALSADMKLSTTEVTERLSKILNFFGCEFEICPTTSHVFWDKFDVLISRKLDGAEPYFDTNLPLTHILRFCVQYSIDLEQFKNLYEDDFLAANFLPNIDDLDFLNFDPLNSFHSAVVSRHLDGRPPWISGKTSIAHVIGVSAKFDVPIGEVCDTLEGWSEILQISFDFLPLDAGISNFVADRCISTILSRNSNSIHPWYSAASLISELPFRCLRNDCDLSDVVSTLRSLGILSCSEAEVDLRAINTVVPDGLRHLIFSKLDQVFSAGSRSGGNYRYSVEELFRVSVKLGVSVLEVREQLLRTSKAFEFEDIPDQVCNYQVRDIDANLLKLMDAHVSRRKKVVGMDAVLDGALSNYISPAEVAEFCSVAEIAGLYAFEGLERCSEYDNRLSLLERSVLSGSEAGADIRRKLGRKIPIGYTLYCSHEFSVPVSEVLSIFCKFAPLLDFDFLDFNESIDDLRIATTEDVLLFSKEFRIPRSWSDVSSTWADHGEMTHLIDRYSRYSGEARSDVIDKVVKLGIPVDIADE